jgi:cyclopropane-fatty-acyl-phospholipid synthase
MSASLNRAPTNYVGPHGPIRLAICKYICRLMITSRKVALATDCANEGDGPDFILCPPPLWITLKILIAPNLWVGESYVAGYWYLKKGSLADFLEIIRKEAPPRFRRYYELLAAFKGFRHYVGQYLLNAHYTRKVREHYEVDSKIYEMILDPEMVYTCAFFASVSDDLQVAQQNKLSAAIDRLSLPPDCSRVLDIGCGWGATERALVRLHPNVQVCALSISESQIAWAKARDAIILGDDQRRRIEYRVEDYIDHRGTARYDAVIIIGMIEHVGLGGYASFFRTLYEFLKPGGTALIHTIVAPTPGKPTNRWIDKHIFTGGYAPSISELIGAVEAQPLQITGVYIYSPSHYRRTIECWLNNFVSNEADLVSYLKLQGESEDGIDYFLRTWYFYLSGVRNMFSESNPRSYQVVQACIKKR